METRNDRISKSASIMISPARLSLNVEGLPARSVRTLRDKVQSFGVSVRYLQVMAATVMLISCSRVVDPSSEDGEHTWHDQVQLETFDEIPVSDGSLGGDETEIAEVSGENSDQQFGAGQARGRLRRKLAALARGSGMARTYDSQGPSLFSEGGYQYSTWSLTLGTYSRLTTPSWINSNPTRLQIDLSVPSTTFAVWTLLHHPDYSGMSKSVSKLDSDPNDRILLSIQTFCSHWRKRNALQLHCDGTVATAY